jgi:predicted nucleic acid-binding protein
MILVDTSVIVAWLDKEHPQHRACLSAIERWARRGKLAVSSVSYAELAAGGRTREAVEEDLRHFERIPLDADSAWRAGMAFRNYRRKDSDDPVLPDFSFGRKRRLAIFLI